MNSETPLDVVHVMREALAASQFLLQDIGCGKRVLDRIEANAAVLDLVPDVVETNNDVELNREKYRIVKQMLDGGPITKDRLVSMFNLVYSMGYVSGYKLGHSDVQSDKDQRVSARITTPGF